MTVSDAIEQLQAMQTAGHGSAILRSYSSLSCEVYPPVRFVLRSLEDNYDIYDPSYGTWVEVI
jgi:hypothetical protein